LQQPGEILWRKHARKKFGPILPYSLPLFVLDHAQRRAYVIWDAQWRGGILSLDKSGGDWTAREVSFWIT